MTPFMERGRVTEQITLYLTQTGARRILAEANSISGLVRGALESLAGLGVTSVVGLKTLRKILNYAPAVADDKETATWRGASIVVGSTTLVLTVETKLQAVSTRQVCAGCSSYSLPVFLAHDNRKYGYCCWNMVTYVCWLCGTNPIDNAGLYICFDCQDQLAVGECATCHTTLDKEDVKGGLCTDCALAGYLISYSGSPTVLLGRRGADRAMRHLTRRERPGLIGVELEVKARRLDIRLQLKNEVGDFAVLKADSSIAPNGFEIVTLPLTLTEHYEKWQAAFSNSLKQCFVDNVCGLHSHIDRPPALVEFKVMAFVARKENQPLINVVSGREENEFCRRYVGESVANLRRLLTSDHHAAVSRSRRNRGATLELRMFGSTLSFEELMGRLEFGDALALFAHKYSLKDMRAPVFVEWLKANRGYPFLLKLLGLRRPISAKALRSGKVDTLAYANPRPSIVVKLGQRGVYGSDQLELTRHKKTDTNYSDEFVSRRLPRNSQQNSEFRSPSSGRARMQEIQMDLAERTGSRLRPPISSVAQATISYRTSNRGIEVLPDPRQQQATIPPSTEPQPPEDVLYRMFSDSPNQVSSRRQR